MANFEELFFTEQDNQKQSEPRNNILDIATRRISQNPENFKTYLTLQSRFPFLSVSNNLRIMMKNPNATEIGNEKYWGRQGAIVRSSEKHNPIIIKDSARNRFNKDGELEQRFYSSEVFDISQTDKKIPAKEPIEPVKALAKLLQSSPYRCEIIDELPKGMLAQYDNENKFIKVLKVDKSKFPELYQALSKEIAFAALDTGEAFDRQQLDFQAACMSFMICQENGINTDSFKFHKMPEVFKNGTEKEIRDFLKPMRDTYEDTIKRMAQNRGNRERHEAR